MFVTIATVSNRLAKASLERSNFIVVETNCFVLLSSIVIANCPSCHCWYRNLGISKCPCPDRRINPSLNDSFFFKSSICPLYSGCLVYACRIYSTTILLHTEKVVLKQINLTDRYNLTTRYLQYLLTNFRH